MLDAQHGSAHISGSDSPVTHIDQTLAAVRAGLEDGDAVMHIVKTLAAEVERLRCRAVSPMELELLNAAKAWCAERRLPGSGDPALLPQLDGAYGRTLIESAMFGGAA